jgi:hypothetical protein
MAMSIEKRLGQCLVGDGTNPIPASCLANIISLMRGQEVGFDLEVTYGAVAKGIFSDRRTFEKIPSTVVARAVEAVIIAKPLSADIFLRHLKIVAADASADYLQGCLRGSLDATTVFDEHNCNYPTFHKEVLGFWPWLIFSFHEEDKITAALEGGFSNAVADYVREGACPDPETRTKRKQQLHALFEEFSGMARNKTSSWPTMVTKEVLNKFMFHTIGILPLQHRFNFILTELEDEKTM